jgi:hypothetical protein
MTTEQINIRREAEGNVRGYHTGIPCDRTMLWIQAIRNMDNVILLRYVHPEDRASIATKMMKADMITRFQAKEFVRFAN